MDNFSSLIEYLPSEETPKKLRRKTLNKIIVLKFRPLIYIISLASIINFFFLSSHIYNHLVQTEAIMVLKVIIQDFELSFDYIANSLAGLKETMPLIRLSILSVNALFMIYLGFIFKRYKNELLKFKQQI